MKRVWVCLVVLAPWVAGAQSLQLKTGAWEITHKGAGLPRPMVDKECVTKADLAQLAASPDKDDDAQCKYVQPPVVTGKTWSADKVCDGGRKVHFEFTAETAERLSGKIVTGAPKGGQAISIEVAGRWLGASCSGIN